ncbi:MAG: hypothetical protein AB7S90_02195 [Marinobacterium sp.]|jgi:hypothetical protein
MLKILSAVTLLTISVSTEARVYTCEEGGRKIYQSTPCTAGDKPVELHVPPPSDQPSHSAVSTSQSDYIEKLRERSRARDARMQLRSEQARAKREKREAIEEAIRRKQVRIGMTADHVIKSWGRPNKVNRSVYETGVHEQWVYRRGAYDAQYVYFENGIVDAIN